MPSKPISSMGAPNGGGPSCLCACTATALNTSAPLTNSAFVLSFIVPYPLLSLAAMRFSPREYRLVFFLREPYGLRQTVAAHEQVHLNPFAGALFVHRQTERSKGAALHSNAEDCSFFALVMQGPGNRRKFCGVISTCQCCIRRGRV